MSFPATSPTMIGREADLAAIREVFTAVEAGEPRGLVVSGEAGIGKTRLVNEFIRSVRGSALVIAGQSVDLGQVAAPYAPITNVLRDLVARVGAEAVLDAAGPGRESLAALLPSLGESSGEIREGGVGRLHETIAVLLETLAKDRPIVLVVEDLHWADGATLRLLSFLVRVLQCDRVMILLTYRSDDVPRGHPVRGFLTELDRTRRVARHEVGRLTRAQVRRQAAMILGATPSEASLESVYTRSEGVPFFVEELLGIDESCSGAELPDTLRELLLARYERLEPQTQQVLRLISAGGVCVEHELIERVFPADADALELAVREAVSAGVLVIDDRAYAFRHALVREAIHADLLPGERSRFHTAFAQAIESAPADAPVAAEIAHHWMAAGNIAKAFPATLTAMSEAHTAFAYSTEAQLGERLLDLWDQVPEARELVGVPRSELMRRVASALRNSGDSDRAISLVDLALAEADDRSDLTQAKLLRDKSSYLSNVGRSGTVELLEQALELVPSGTPGDLRAALLNALGARHMIEGSIDQAIAFTDEAAAEALLAGSPRHASIAANLGGISRMHRGEIEYGKAMLNAAQNMAEGDANALLRHGVNASDMANLLGSYEESLELALDGVALAKSLGVERSSGVILSSNAVDPLIALGRWDEADETLDRVLSLEPPLAFSVYLRQSKVLSTLWRGDPEGALRLYRAWKPAMQRLAQNEVQTKFGVAHAAAEVALGVDDLDEAWTAIGVLAESGHQLMASYDLSVLGIAARVLARVRSRLLDGAVVGDSPDSPLAGVTLEDLEEHETSLREMLQSEAAWPTAPVWTAMFEAELGGSRRTGDGPALWELAVQAAQLSVAPALLRPYSRFRLGEAQLACGDRAAAQETLDVAIGEAEALGAGLVTQWARTVAARGGLGTDGRVRVRNHDAAELTARERQVLDLVSAGLSNRQIGERLFISTKTASVHVSAILRKLGATSRTEAAVLAGAGGQRVAAVSSAAAVGSAS
ncbi:helix-turn-helix transcriptional regulator [Plantibacter sp. YIM 135347]|uniref:helix-turn-helix transcriptional regulator n=1 Tax=Plantibacter sp. YIM 135347 TaxID=3423919 RepID=UPI003D351532